MKNKKWYELDAWFVIKSVNNHKYWHSDYSLRVLQLKKKVQKLLNLIQLNGKNKNLKASYDKFCLLIKKSHNNVDESSLPTLINALTLD